MNNYFYVLIVIFIIFNMLPEYIRYIYFLLLSLIIIILFSYKYQDSVLEFIKSPGIKSSEKTEKDYEEEYISNLEKYEKYNKSSFKNAIKYYKLYKKSYDKYESSDYTNIFANSPDYYLGLSMNSYLEINLSIKNITYRDALNNNRFDESDERKTLYDNINKLYNFNIKKLYNLYKDKNDKDVNSLDTKMYIGPKSYEYEDSIYKIF